MSFVLSIEAFVRCFFNSVNYMFYFVVVTNPFDSVFMILFGFPSLKIAVSVMFTSQPKYLLSGYPVNFSSSHTKSFVSNRK